MDAKGSDPMPPFAQSPLSPLGVEGFDGGPRESGDGTSLQGQRASAASLYLERPRGIPTRLSTPSRLTLRVNGQTSGLNGALHGLDLGERFSLLYETGGLSPTSGARRERQGALGMEARCTLGANRHPRVAS